jgi:hypothetical protein
MTRAIIFAVTILLCAGGVYAQWGQQGLLMTGGGGGPSPSGPTPTLVQAYFGDRSNNGANACSNNICTWPLTHPIAAGHTVVGYVHGANGADNAPMYPQSIKDQNGNSYTITPAAEWTPFHEDIIVWYLQNVPATVTSFTMDFAQYNGSLDVGTFADTGYAEYANVQSLTVVNPFASNSATPSLTITPTSPALIWAFGSVFISDTAGSMQTSGYTTLLVGNGDNIAIWGSNELVTASSQTLTWSNPVGPPGDCTDWAPNGCSAVIAAVAVQGFGRGHDQP